MSVQFQKVEENEEMSDNKVSTYIILANIHNWLLSILLVIKRM